MAEMTPSGTVAARRLRVEALGAVRAWLTDRELALGAPRQRAVLAVLALRANQPVTRDQLIDAIWGYEPPAAATNVVHTYVARLRRVLDPGRAGGLARSASTASCRQPGQDMYCGWGPGSWMRRCS